MVREWNIWDEMKRMQDEMDRIFSSFFNREPFRSTELLKGPEAGYLTAENLKEPLSDILEDDKDIMVNIEIPGVEKDDIMITSKDGRLEIKAQIKEEIKEEDKERGRYRFERKYAGFYRYFNLPENADSENIDANYKNGILKLRVPKKKIKEEKRKRVEVR